MFGGDSLAQLARGLGIGDVACLPLAERQPVGVARRGAGNVEAPGSGESMIRSEDRGVENGFDLPAGDGALGELLDGAALLDDLGNWHAYKLRDRAPPPTPTRPRSRTRGHRCVGLRTHASSCQSPGRGIVRLWRAGGSRTCRDIA